MPDKNSEYKRLLALSKKPEYQALLAMIRKGEGTSGELGYNTHVGGSTFSSLAKKNRTYVEDLDSTASGAYQFINKTWDNIAKKVGITDFSKESQDVAAIKLFESIPGAKKALDEGDLKSAMYKAGKQWAGVPINSKGDSMASGQNARDPIELLNLGFKKLNIERANSKDPEVRKKNYDTQKQFYKEIEAVNKQNVSDEAKNVLQQEIYQKYYRSGDMAHINNNIENRNNIAKSNQLLLDTFDRYKSGKMSAAEKKTYEKALKDRKIDIPYLPEKKYNSLTQPFDFEGNAITGPQVNVDALQSKLTSLATDSPANKGINKVPALMTYGIRADEKLLDDTNVSNSSESQDFSGSADIGTRYTDNGKTVGITAKQTGIENIPNLNQNTFTSEDLLSQFRDGSMLTDPAFKYSPGKQEIPFDALANLAIGGIGMAAGDIDIKYRDEKVSEGLLNYAAELEQIKNIGLPPEIEGDLKMKLSAAYQTGLTNIVRASNGNRNLVLGNQGQLDQARMQGVVQIAALDVDRRDKAMAAYGEVQKYINEFNANRDISNNERRYREDEKKQIGAAQLAQSGMSGLMDALQAQRENAPGSPNDMMKQFLMFHISGVNKDAKPGDPGSPEYMDKIVKEKEIKQTGKDRMLNFAKSLSPDNQKELAQYLSENPNDNVSINSSADIDKVINLFSEATGRTSSQNSFKEQQGINPAEAELSEKETDKTYSESDYSPDPMAVISAQAAPEKMTGQEFIYNYRRDNPGSAESDSDLMQMHADLISPNQPSKTDSSKLWSGDRSDFNADQGDINAASFVNGKIPTSQDMLQFTQSNNDPVVQAQYDDFSSFRKIQPVQPTNMPIVGTTPPSDKFMESYMNNNQDALKAAEAAKQRMTKLNNEAKQYHSKTQYK